MSEDRIIGALLGLAYGDRIGGPIRMTLQLGTSLIQQQKFDIDDILEHYLKWWKKEGFDTGPVANNVFKLIDNGQSYHDATQRIHVLANERTAGCNPAHRALPFAMAGFISNAELPILVHKDAKLTHWDAIAGDVAANVVSICRLLIQGVDWLDAMQQTLPDFTIEQVTNSASKRFLSRSGFAPDVLLASLYFVTHHDNFESALANSIGFAGSANYCPVLVGAFSGARWGRSAIPISALNHHQSILLDIERVANGLAMTW